jgi:hypothetical protein
MRSPCPLLLLFLQLAAMGACRRPPPVPPPLTPVFRTDSAVYGVTLRAGYYNTTIRFTYTNPVRTVLSSDGCHGPWPPALEKLVAGEWAVAYHPVLPLCGMEPPFRLAPGATHRAALGVTASPRGSGRIPELRVDSLAGTYRLRWILRVGPHPRDPTEVWVVAVSNSFQLVER